MSRLITDASAELKCALYNELSHMTPYYLHSNNSEELNINAEAVFHLNNLKLLCLYFDKIYIPIENILSFANQRNMLVVQHVVNSNSFKELVELDIVNLCGWGAQDSHIMLNKGISYATKEYEHLKKSAYLKGVEDLSSIHPLKTRDVTRFDIGFDRHLLETMALLDSPANRASLEKGTKFVSEFYKSYKYIGSLEFYKWVEINELSETLAHSLYKTFYRSWQEYCFKNYAPVITVNSERIRYSFGDINIGDQEKPVYVKALLYSPRIFLKFLEWQLGRKVSRHLISLSPARIQSIRNGDGAWNLFKEKYHTCIQASSSIFGLNEEMWHLRNGFDEASTKEILEQLFERKIHKLEKIPIVDVVKVLSLPLAWLAQVFNPATVLTFLLTHLFKKTSTAPFAREVIPFYRKAVILTKSNPIVLTV